MLANSSKYALSALVYLVRNSSEENKIRAHRIAEMTLLPKPYLSKLLRQLASKDLISSTKGLHGGFYLSEAQKENSILEIIIEVEGKDRLQLCVLNLENCDAQKPCPMHHLVSGARTDYRKCFENMKLKDLLN